MLANGLLPFSPRQDAFIARARTYKANPQAVEYVDSGGIRAEDQRYRSKMMSTHPDIIREKKADFNDFNNARGQMNIKFCNSKNPGRARKLLS